jgi:hypothetical protein
MNVPRISPAVAMAIATLTASMTAWSSTAIGTACSDPLSPHCDAVQSTCDTVKKSCTPGGDAERPGGCLDPGNSAVQCVPKPIGITCNHYAYRETPINCWCTNVPYTFNSNHGTNGPACTYGAGTPVIGGGTE